MASPSTPPAAHRSFGSHRSFTVPARIGSSSRSSSFGSRDPTIEVLFETPQCKLVSFEPVHAGPRARTSSLGANGAVSSPVGELPYSTRSERILAIGPLAVYRPPGSVAFLNFGKNVHPILPRSACWCVDGQSKFVIGAPGGKYYRIELPWENGTDQAKANDFKVVLATIAQYETTACPFKRGFHVELPELSPATPRRPWQPKHSPGVTSPLSPEGHHLLDGGHIQRRFPSPPRRTSQSPRRPYQARSVTSEHSDIESISDAGRSQDENRPVSEPRVSRMIATFEEFGPRLDTLSVTSSSVPSKQVSPALSPQLSPSEPTKDATEDENTGDATVKEHQRAIGQILEAQNTDDEPEVLLSEPEATDSELSEASEPGSEHASPFKKTILPQLHVKDDLESLSWLDDGEPHETPTTAKPYLGIRFVTAPVSSLLQNEQPFKTIEGHHQNRPRHDSETESLASVESSSSFHSLHSPTSPVDRSLSVSASGSPITAPSISPQSLKVHKRDMSDATITIDTNRDIVADLSTPTWPSFSPNHEANATDAETEADADAKSFRTASPPPSPERKSRSVSPSKAIQMRLRRRRTQSPLPPPANLYIPQASLSGHLTNIILQKTCSLLLGPPVQLVALMLNLARKFADGQLKSDSYTYGEQGQPIPCEWCDSDLDVDGENSSEEDDYGISIGGTPEKVSKKPARRRRTVREARWDID